MTSSIGAVDLTALLVTSDHNLVAYNEITQRVDRAGILFCTRELPCTCAVGKPQCYVA